jgi:hypothetical protein
MLENTGNVSRKIERRGMLIVGEGRESKWISR